MGSFLDRIGFLYKYWPCSVTPVEINSRTKKSLNHSPKMQIPFINWQSFLFTVVLSYLGSSASMGIQPRTNVHREIDLYTAGPKISSQDDPMWSAQHPKRDVRPHVPCELPGAVGPCPGAGTQ